MVCFICESRLANCGLSLKSRRHVNLRDAGAGVDCEKVISLRTDIKKGPLCFQESNEGRQIHGKVRVFVCLFVLFCFIYKFLLVLFTVFLFS